MIPQWISSPAHDCNVKQDLAVLHAVLSACVHGPAFVVCTVMHVAQHLSAHTEIQPCGHLRCCPVCLLFACISLAWFSHWVQGLLYATVLLSMPYNALAAQWSGWSCRGLRLVDAAVFEAVPFRVAIADGCTHIITLCSRPPYK